MSLSPFCGDCVVSTLLWLPCLITTLLWLPPSHSDSVVTTLLWLLHGFHPPLVTMCGYHPLSCPLTVVTLWFPPSCGYPAWLPTFHGDSMVSTLHAELFFVLVYMWCLPGNYMVCTWKLHGIHVETMWCPHGNHVMSMWQPHCVYMETTWCPYGNHVLSI